MPSGQIPSGTYSQSNKSSLLLIALRKMYNIEPGRDSGRKCQKNLLYDLELYYVIWVEFKEVGLYSELDSGSGGNLNYLF